MRAATQTPIGALPAAGDLDLDGISLTDEAREVLFGYDSEGWRAEFEGIGRYLAEYGERMPRELRAEQVGILTQLAG